MRLSHSLILAGALLLAAPAVAQNEAAAPANSAATANETNATAANAAAPTTPTNAAAMPGEQNVALPPNVATPADTGATVAVKSHRGFPWGVLGLLGLIGLFGARKSSS